MKDQGLINELASCPPNVWAHRLHQASIIDPLLSDGATSRDIEIACAELGVTRRRVRQLMEFAQQRRLETKPRGNATGFGLWLEDKKECLISEALSLAGGSASLKTVCDLVEYIGRKRQVPLPSTATIRHRFNETRSRKRSFGQLHLAREATLDLAPLYLSVYDEKDAPRTAWLLTGFDSQTTQIFDYEIFSGRPTPSSLSRAIHLFGRDRGGSDCYGATTAILKTLKNPPSKLGQKVEPASSRRSITAGAVTRCAFGLRIGKIKLRADTLSLGEADLAPVTLEVAREVLGCLLQKGATDYEPWSGSNIPSASSAT